MCKKIWIVLLAIVLAGCSTGYKVKPLPFKAPASFQNAVTLEGAQVAAKAYTDKKETQEAFGFDILGAGMLPVQVVFDNAGSHTFEINGSQTFLEDRQGNLWPILSRELAYARATKHAKTRDILKNSAYKGLLGAAAGSIIGAAIGIVSGQNVGEAVGKGAVIGAAAGATIGGAIGYGSDEARRSIVSDLRQKSLQNSEILPKSLAHGFLFFPGEAKDAGQLRLQLQLKDTGEVRVVKLDFK